jgi:Leucine-rich repeat (LRR) protein
MNAGKRSLLLILTMSLLAVTRSVTISDCPSTCTCMQNLQTLTLTCNASTSSITLPNAATTSSLLSVTKILLRGSAMNAMPSNLCGYQYYLNYLDLSSNSISTYLNSSNFMCLGALRFLNLSNNDIASLDPATFDYQTLLATLDLSYNQISSLPTNLFASSNLSSYKLRNLKYLYLQNNQIVLLDPWYFYLPSIVYINMASNQITNFTNNLGFYINNGLITPQLRRLQYFDLTDNNIELFDDYILGKQIYTFYSTKSKISSSVNFLVRF